MSIDFGGGKLFVRMEDGEQYEIGEVIDCNSGLVEIDTSLFEKAVGKPFVLQEPASIEISCESLFDEKMFYQVVIGVPANNYLRLHGGYAMRYKNLKKCKRFHGR